MAIKVTLPQNSTTLIGDIASYTANIEAMPIDANDTSGSTWSMNVTAPASLTKIDSDGNRVNLPGAKRTTSLLGKEITISDYGMFSGESKFDYQKQEYGRGSFSGTVSSMSINAGDTLELTVDSVLFKMNCEKKADPHYGATATKKTAFIYYCSLAGITVIPENVDDAFNVPVAYPAWKGNVWDYIKMFCVANKADLRVDSSGQLHLEKIRKNTIPVIESSGASMSITLLGTARAIEIYDYNSSWESDALIYSAETTFQVNFGETVKELVDIEASVLSEKIIQPECVSSIQPVPFTGGNKSIYVVVDNLNYPVSPSWWNDNGGKVTVKISDENPFQLEVNITGPYSQVNSPYVEPFRLAEYDSDSRPALYVCATDAVLVKKVLRSVATGADSNFISRDSKATVDNIFINDEIAYHLSQSAAFATGPNIDVNLVIGSSGLQDEINNVAGSRFFYNNGYYRARASTLSESGISLNAKPDTVFDDLVLIYSTNFNSYNTTVTYNTFALFNSDTNNSGKVFSDFNSSYPAKSFNDLGQYYLNMTFSDMSVMPLGDTLNPYVN